jgi:transcriptional regulator with XRE-family HTH domain
MRLRTVIGAALRRRRLAQGRTLREVAAVAGVSLTYLSEVERGRKEASSEVLEAICDALGLVLAHLLFEVAEELARVDARASVSAVGFIPDRAVPRRLAAAEPVRTIPPRTASAGTAADGNAPVARVFDLRAFAGRRSA